MTHTETVTIDRKNSTLTLPDGSTIDLNNNLDTIVQRLRYTGFVPGGLSPRPQHPARWARYQQTIPVSRIEDMNVDNKKLTLIAGHNCGVERATLDAAITSGCDYTGYVPPGGLTPDYPTPPGMLHLYDKLQPAPFGPNAYTGKQERRLNLAENTIVLTPEWASDDWLINDIRNTIDEFNDEKINLHIVTMSKPKDTVDDMVRIAENIAASTNGVPGYVNITGNTDKKSYMHAWSAVRGFIDYIHDRDPYAHLENIYIS